MKCVSCQSEIPDGANFCGVCGSKQNLPSADPFGAADNNGPTLIATPAVPPIAGLPMPGQLSPEDTMPTALSAVVPSEPAPAPVPEPAPVAEPAPEPAPAVVAEPAPKPAAAEPAPADKKGGFRETMWFMDALDPEKLSDIDTDDMRYRTEKFEDHGESMPSAVREKFSLNTDAQKAPRRTMMRMARLELERATVDRSGGNLGLIIGAVVVVASATAAGWWFFVR